ncbi:MAG: 50S ribosomal protein L30 [Sphaerochaetaceae bacterium]|nr:50S ribosomal protein L30 [Sphaerochaetaceae bacterium]MDC7236867.1 50S ribosomal protein L30 [Sphaerochaetaceae bacterium]MDC7243974.1 50S ribosomal protein L30 [Sphaerochaetaceae bacterium]
MAKKEKQLKVTLTRSVAGTLPKQRRTVKAIGLNRINSSVVINATPDMLGMVNVIAHLVEVEEM